MTLKNQDFAKLIEKPDWCLAGADQGSPGTPQPSGGGGSRQLREGRGRHAREHRANRQAPAEGAGRERRGLEGDADRHAECLRAAADGLGRRAQGRRRLSAARRPRPAIGRKPPMNDRSGATVKAGLRIGQADDWRNEMNTVPLADVFEIGLDSNAANYAALTPLTFIERAAFVYPEHVALVYGEVRRSWAETYGRCCQLASALAAARHRQGRYGGGNRQQHSRDFRSSFRRPDDRGGVEHAQHAARLRGARLHAAARRGEGDTRRPRIRGCHRAGCAHLGPQDAGRRYRGCLVRRRQTHRPAHLRTAPGRG